MHRLRAAAGRHHGQAGAAGAALSKGNGTAATALDPLAEVVSCLLPAGARIGVLGPEGEDVLPLERQGYELLAIAAREPEASMRELRAAETRGARFVVADLPRGRMARLAAAAAGAPAPRVRVRDPPEGAL